jgi:hypothetical protein
MPYYPIALTSEEEVPDDARLTREVNDFHESNFRRTAALPEGNVKVIDLGD